MKSCGSCAYSEKFDYPDCLEEVVCEHWRMSDFYRVRELEEGLKEIIDTKGCTSQIVFNIKNIARRLLGEE